MITTTRPVRSNTRHTGVYAFPHLVAPRLPSPASQFQANFPQKHYTHVLVSLPRPPPPLFLL